MATNPKQQSGQNDADPFVILALILLVGLLVYVFWSKYHTPVATFYSWLRVVQFSPFVVLNNIWTLTAGILIAIGGGVTYFLTRKWNRYLTGSVVIGIISVLGYVLGNFFSSWFFFFKDSEKSLLQWQHLTKSSTYSNLITILFLLIPLAVWIVRRSLNTNPTNHKHYGRTKDYTLHTFTDKMAEHYKHLSLFRKLNLTDKPINSGKYRMADTEKEFAIKHRLLDRVKPGEFKVNKDRAAGVFVEQMTKLWTGYNALSQWEIAVIAVLLPRIAATEPTMPDDEYKAALETTEKLLLGYWADADKTYDPKKDTIRLDLQLAKRTIKKYGHLPKVKAFYKQHAYVGTVFYSMLITARTLGVLQPAELRWLRIVDRRLWLIIDNVGKIVCTTEAAATYAHFLHELKRKRAIEKPMIDGAVKGLIEAVEGYAFADDEIETVNAQLAEVEAALLIESQAAMKQRLRLFVMALSEGIGSNRDVVDVAVLKESGELYFEMQCMPKVDGGDQGNGAQSMSDDEILARKKLPDADFLRRKMLEICNGHELITFDKDDLKVIPGLERSADSLTECKGDEGFDLTGTAVMEGVVSEDDVKPIKSAREAASLCRLIWVAYQKAGLEASRGKDGSI